MRLTAQHSLPRRRGALVAVLSAVAFGAVAALLTPTTAADTIATLYVSYGANYAFQITTDAGPVAAGTVLPPGQYQVLATSSVLYTELPGNPCIPTFELTGTGVSFQQQYDTFGSPSAVTLSPSATYVALDACAPNVTTTFTTSATGSPSVPVSTTSTVAANGKTSALNPIGTAVSSTRLPYRGSLAASVGAAGRLALEFKGKAVATLVAGRYTLVVVNHSRAAAFVLRKVHRASSITAAHFNGKRTLSVTLTAGQWYYSPSFLGAKSYFFVTSS